MHQIRLHGGRPSPDNTLAFVALSSDERGDALSPPAAGCSGAGLPRVADVKVALGRIDAGRVAAVGEEAAGRPFQTFPPRSLRDRQASNMGYPKDENGAAAAEGDGAGSDMELCGDRHRPEARPAAAATTENTAPLEKQSSVLSLTMDELQSSACEPGASFGSMNIDDFLTTILTAEKGGAGGAEIGGGGGQPEAPRNAALDGAFTASWSIPSLLCRKTVDEVWSEVHGREEEKASQLGHLQRRQPEDLEISPAGAGRQPTFGEMTLEDFLVKAGIVREGGNRSPTSAMPADQFPGRSQPPEHQKRCSGLAAAYPHAGCGGPVASAGFTEHHTGVGSNGVHQGQARHQTVVAHGGERLGTGSPASPVSSGGGQVASSNEGADQPGARRMSVAGAFAAAAAAGRKRILEGGTVEKVVERRQRRMMKNRESAARSRARKQAYTVELEKELHFLKEENTRLREEQRRATASRRQRVLEAIAGQYEANNAQRRGRRRKVLRQCWSCTW